MRTRGYIPATVRVKLAHSRGVVRIYRRSLQWRQYGVTPARTQAHSGIDLRPPFRRVWTRRVDSLLEFPAVVWSGVAYADTMLGNVTAFSMRNGRILWRTRVGTKMAASPGLAPERHELVVVTMEPGEVLVLNMRTGKIKYRRSIGPSEPSPLVLGGVAYLASSTGYVYAFDLARRRFRWVRSLGAKITSSPAAVGGRLYLGDYAGASSASRPERAARSGPEAPGAGSTEPSPSPAGRSSRPPCSPACRRSARTGRLLWRNSVGAYLYSAPAYYHGRVFYGTYAGIVYSADADSGRIRWARSAGGAVSGAVELVAGVVYAGALTHRITAWSWRRGRRLWSFRPGKYVPVSGNGGRLLMHGTNRIIAVEPRRHPRRP